MKNKMQVGFIGGGKVGCSLGKYMQLHQVFVSGYYNKSKASSEFASKFTQTNCYEQIRYLVDESTIIFITVPDDQITTVWKQIVDEVGIMILKEKYIFHCSGIYSSQIFEHSEENCLNVGSFHPICAISDREIGYKSFQQAIFSYEGSTEGKSMMEVLLKKMGNTGVKLEADQKIRYHAAAVFSSNLMIGLLQQAIDIFIECGFTKQEAERAISSLAVGNMKNIETQGLDKALTGPIERNDMHTIQLHLEALDKKEQELYRSLSLKIIPIAQRNHPERDYTKIKEILLNEKHNNFNVETKKG